MITKQPTTPAFKVYRRAWKLFDLGLISREELVQMLDDYLKIQKIKGKSYVN